MSSAGTSRSPTRGPREAHALAIQLQGLGLVVRIDKFTRNHLDQLKQLVLDRIAPLGRRHGVKVIEERMKAADHLERG